MSQPRYLCLAVRGYLGESMVSEKHLNIPQNEIDGLVQRLANEHGALMSAGLIDMVEMEFVDEPDPKQRYLRVGINPTGMVFPIEVRA
jgi:hypothetical protein